MGSPGEVTRAIVARLADNLLLEGAAGLAARLNYPGRFKVKKIGSVLCGGNIEPLLLAASIERGMVRAGRLARIAVSARDVPGSLAKVTAAVADAGANKEEVSMVIY